MLISGFIQSFTQLSVTFIIQESIRTHTHTHTHTHTPIFNLLLFRPLFPSPLPLSYPSSSPHLPLSLPSLFIYYRARYIGIYFVPVPIYWRPFVSHGRYRHAMLIEFSGLWHYSNFRIRPSLYADEHKLNWDERTGEGEGERERERERGRGREKKCIGHVTGGNEWNREECKNYEEELEREGQREREVRW